MTDRPIEDLIRTVRDAYAKLSEVYPRWMGKSSEGTITVTYPTIWDEKVDPFVPKSVTVYSYALGPSRNHHFFRADKEKNPNYYTWESPTPVAKAIEVVTEWAAKLVPQPEDAM